MMWMDLEPVIDGKTKSEREKQVLYTYRHTYRIQENGSNEPICKAGIDTKRQRTDLRYTGGGKEWAGQRGALKYTLYVIQLVCQH